MGDELAEAIQSGDVDEIAIALCRTVAKMYDSQDDAQDELGYLATQVTHWAKIVGESHGELD